VSEMPVDIGEDGHRYFVGRCMEVRADWTLTDVGGCIPVEPPLQVPAGSKIILGDITDDGRWAFYSTLNVYVDGHRTCQYRFSDGKYIPAEQRSQ